MLKWCIVAAYTRHKGCIVFTYTMHKGGTVAAYTMCKGGTVTTYTMHKGYNKQDSVVEGRTATIAAAATAADNRDDVYDGDLGLFLL